MNLHFSRTHRSEPCHRSVNHAAKFENMADLRFADLADIHAPMRQMTHQTLDGKTLQRFANRSAADLELVNKVALRQGRTGFQLQSPNHFHEDLVGVLTK